MLFSEKIHFDGTKVSRIRFFKYINIQKHTDILLYINLIISTLKMLLNLDDVKKCPITYVLAINDTLNTFQGKWKMPIIGVLIFGKKRFKEISREIPRITPRMLSQELKDLEVNGIITRTVYNTIPVTVEYELTPSGHRLHTVLEAENRHRKLYIHYNLTFIALSRQFQSGL